MSLFTTGATKVTVGNATTNANPQAFSQSEIKLSTKPTLNKVITNDIKNDINSAIKNEKTKRWYLLGIIAGDNFIYKTRAKFTIVARVSGKSCD